MCAAARGELPDYSEHSVGRRGAGEAHGGLVAEDEIGEQNASNVDYRSCCLVVVLPFVFLAHSCLLSSSFGGRCSARACCCCCCRCRCAVCCCPGSLECCRRFCSVVVAGAGAAVIVGLIGGRHFCATSEILPLTQLLAAAAAAAAAAAVPLFVVTPSA